jgi:hypothetical protein
MNEGYTVGASYITDTIQTTNYPSTISTPVEWTNLQLKEWSYLGKGFKENRMRADKKAMAIEHLKEIEKHILFSYKSKVTDADGKNLYFTNGILASIQTNVHNHGGAADMTEDEFIENVVEPLFRVGDSTKKMMAMSSRCLSIMESWGRENLRFEEKMEHTMGFPVGRYRTTRGEIKVFHHPMLDVVPEEYISESVIGFDLSFLRLAMVEDTKYNPDLQLPNQKVKLDEWSTIIGLDVEYEETMVHSYDWDNV